MTQNRTLVPKSTRSLVLVLVIVASLFLFVGTAAAQGGTCPSSATTLRLGDSSTGNITNADYADFYCFNANAGDVVVIDLVATGGNLDPLIVVSDVDLTTMLGRDDDGGDGLNSRLEFRAPETGIYLLSVTRFNIADGTSSGSYRVTISGSGSGGPGPQVTETPLVTTPTTVPSSGDGERLDPEELCPSTATVIDFEEVETFSNTGQITNDDFADFYCFIGYQGDRFEIDLQATSGNLDTFIVISDPDFEAMVASDDDGGEGLNSFLDLEISETAPYMLSVTRFNVANGTSSGSYSVTVTLIDRPNPPDSGGGGGDCVSGIDLDDPISILTASVWYADFGNDTEVTVTFAADGTVTFTLGDITTTTEFTVSGDEITFPLGQSVYEIREVSPTMMALGTEGNASIEFEPLTPIVAGGGDCPTEEPVVDSGDCDSGPLGQLVFGEWRIIGNDALEFDFQCDGVLIITNDGSPSTVSYTFSGSTIELQVGSETIVWTDVILTDSALIVTVESSGNTLFLANTEAE